MSNIQTNAM